MKTIDFDYHLPPGLIAQTPLESRDHSRLMLLDRKQQSIAHNFFYNLPELLQEGDILVFNDSRVIPARLFGLKKDTGTRVETFLLRRIDTGIWETLVKPGKKLRKGAVIKFSTGSDDNNTTIEAEITGVNVNGTRIIRFSSEDLLEKIGNVPLPPYINRAISEPERYQTVYSRIKGSVAAPTAGLHFTRELLKTLQDKGIKFAFVTLHIGLDTFQPVREEDPASHKIHTEYGEIREDTVELLNKAKDQGNRIISVGTSTTRILEAATQSGKVRPFTGNTDLFILPGYKFQITDALITNFHLPKSTLLMLVSAFAGKEFIFKAYEEAIENKYRFYSFGDAMFIT
jgi:S-adenosylmethionine:tRNA ribosyltransferase-isomerase